MAAAAAGGSAGPTPANEAQACGLEPIPLSGDELLAACEPDAEHTLGGAHNTEDPEHPSTVGHMVRSLMPGQDLTRVTIPSWFLESRSLLEKMTDTMMHPQLLLPASTQATPEERMISLARWYVSGWHYKLPGVKKPYNPIIGETFAATWEHSDGSRSQYVAEQVLHRPPVTAFYFENRKNHIVCNGQVHTRSKFSAPQSAMSILDGGLMMTLTNHKEDYWMTFPDANAHNLLMGTLRMEFGGESSIYCKQTDCKTTFTWHQKPFWGGEDKIAKVTAVVTSKGKEVATLEGHWNGPMHITRAGGKQEMLVDSLKEPIMPKRVLPVHLQGPWESRRLWARTSQIMNTRPKVEWTAVDESKGVLEEDQRLLACHKKAEEFQEWQPRLFAKGTFTVPETGDKKEGWHTYKHLSTAPYAEGEEAHNLIQQSRDAAFADERNKEPAQTAGLAGANAKVPEEFRPKVAGTAAAAPAKEATPSS